VRESSPGLRMKSTGRPPSCGNLAPSARRGSGWRTTIRRRSWNPRASRAATLPVSPLFHVKPVWCGRHRSRRRIYPAFGLVRTVGRWSRRPKRLSNRWPQQEGRIWLGGTGAGVAGVRSLPDRSDGQAGRWACRPWTSHWRILRPDGWVRTRSGPLANRFGREGGAGDPMNGGSDGRSWRGDCQRRRHNGRTRQDNGPARRRSGLDH